MRNFGLLLVLLLLLASPEGRANNSNGVQWVGPVTASNCVAWLASGQIYDPGTGPCGSGGSGTSVALSASTSSVAYSIVGSAVTSVSPQTQQYSLLFTYNPSTKAVNIPTGGTYNVNGTALHCTSLTDAVASCSTDTTNASNISSGTLASGRMALGTNAAPGAVQGDGTTTTISGGVISTIGGGAGGNPNVNAYSVYGNATASTTTGTSIQAITLGIPAVTDTGVALQMTTSTNSFYQTILDNTSTGTAASVSYTTAIGTTTSTTNYAEFGQNGQGFSGSGSLNLASAGYVDTVGVDLAIGTLTNNALHFTTSGATTDRMTINSNGGVTTGGATNNGAGTLDVSGTLEADGLNYPTSLTSGGVVYASSTTQMASSALLTANLPVFGGGAGAAPVSGTRSGNTTEVVTGTGSYTSGDLADIDANGNVIDAGVLASNQKIRAIEFVIDGGGSTITTGVKGFLLVPMACTITKATLLGDQSGSIVVDIWALTFGSALPTVTNTITASAIPTISSAVTHQDSTLTGWTTALTANEMLGFNVNSVTTMTRVTVILTCNAT